MLNSTKDLILKLNEINDNTINTIISKIRIVLSEIANVTQLNTHSIWIRVFFTEQFTTLMGNLMFWYNTYYSNTPGEELLRIQYRRNKSFIVYVVLLASKGYIERLMNKAYETLKEVLMQRHPIMASMILPIIDLLIPSMQTLNDIHMMYFLLNNSNHMNLLQMILGMSYENKDNKDLNQFGFKLIGLIIMIRLLIKLIQYSRMIYQKIINTKSTNELSKVLRLCKDNKDNKCLLCLNNYIDISSTICGHLFCWKCIIDYLQQSTKCPQCRHPCNPSQVIYLQNY